MTKIIKYDNSCQIIEESNQKTIKALDYQLSYRIKGAEHSKAFKGYMNQRGEEITWDGRRHLLQTDLRFPLGLLEKVIDFYTDRGLDFEIIDQRRNLEPANPIDIISNLKKIDIEPRQYQLDAVETASKYNRGIIRAATGAGKTAIIALLVAKIGKPATVLVIGKDLLYQFHKFFSSVFDEEIGIIGDGKCDIKRINIATIWSVGDSLNIKIESDEDSQEEKPIIKEKYRDIKTMLLQSSVMVLDECHICACETVQEISHNIKAEYWWGTSASPWRDDNADLLIESVLGRKIVDISAKYLIDNGFLVKPIIRFLSVPEYSGSQSSKYQTVYKNYITVNEIRNGMICTATQKLVEQGFKVLVLFKSKAHGKRLHKLISTKVSCDLLDGDDKFSIRDNVCNKLKNGEIDCIIASTIFDIGVDLPILSALVSAGGGKSSVRALQRIGRCIRKYENKTIAPVIDFADRAPFLFDHALKRKEILETEFEDVEWPKNK